LQTFSPTLVISDSSRFSMSTVSDPLMRFRALGPTAHFHQQFTVICLDKLLNSKDTSNRYQQSPYLTLAMGALVRLTITPVQRSVH